MSSIRRKIIVIFLVIITTCVAIGGIPLSIVTKNLIRQERMYEIVSSEQVYRISIEAVVANLGKSIFWIEEEEKVNLLEEIIDYEYWQEQSRGILSDIYTWLKSKEETLIVRVEYHERREVYDYVVLQVIDSAYESFPLCEIPLSSQSWIKEFSINQCIPVQKEIMQSKAGEVFGDGYFLFDSSSFDGSSWLDSFRKVWRVTAYASEITIGLIAFLSLVLIILLKGNSQRALSIGTIEIGRAHV